MKRNVLYGAIMSLAVIVFGMTGCGQSHDASEVAKKIDAQEALNQRDYATVLDYCGEYARKAQTYFDAINAQPSDTTAEYLRVVNEMAQLSQEYPYLDMFRGVIYNLKADDLDADNQKKVEEFARYQAFPLPEGDGPDLSIPGVEGLIEDMPSQAGTDSTGVIATGDGIVEEKDVR